MVQELQEAGPRLAVVDADGVVDGVVMLEDTLEALVGAERDRTHAEAGSGSVDGR